MNQTTKTITSRYLELNQNTYLLFEDKQKTMNTFKTKISSTIDMQGFFFTINALQKSADNEQAFR